MAVCYDKLFHLLIDKRMTNAQLADKASISANIITRIKKNEDISHESIEKLCHAVLSSLSGLRACRPYPKMQYGRQYGRHATFPLT